MHGKSNGKCNAITKSGKACQGTAIPGSQWCMSHHPDLTEVRREGQVRGGIEKATARRQAKAWALVGAEVSDHDLNAILKSAMFAVKNREMTPSEANAIAALARTAITIRNEVDLAERIAALEETINQRPGNIRRMG